MSMGRRRGGRFADRPPNVDLTVVSDVTYFRYVFPDGRRQSIGNSVDLDGAYAKAIALNGHFAQQKVDVSTMLQQRKVLPTSANPLIPDLIKEFRTHDPKRKKLAERTRSEQDFKLNLYAKHWLGKTVREIQTTDISSLLNELTDNAYVKHRALLWGLFQFAGHQGYITLNPVGVTLVKSESKKVRQRHTLEGYQKILEAAPDWLQRAMRIGLYSLQRREDVVMLHKTANKVDLKTGTITILQRKTRNYANPVWIEIEMGEQLHSAVADCLGSPVLCPYLIHRHPEKMTKQAREAKGHPFAVLPGYLSRAFREVRDKAKVYDHLTEKERPTFHELRSLGSHLYKQAGYSTEYMMLLSGHASAATLERYLKDHEEKKPVRVAAGLNSKQLPT